MPDRTCGVYYAEQWTANDQGQWWGDLIFAIGDEDRIGAERQRCAAMKAANTFLEAEGSPYRLP